MFLLLAWGVLWTSTLSHCSQSFNNFTITAFDCSHPTNVRTETIEVMNACSMMERTPDRRNETLQLLQVTSFIHLDAYRCHLVQTRSVRYCGVYDHQTELGSFSFVQVPQNVSEEQCRQWIRTLQFTDVLGGSHPLSLQSTTIAQVYEAGKEEVQDGEVRCLGQDVNFGGEIIHRAVVKSQYSVTLEELPMVIRRKDLEVTVGSIRMGVPATEQTDYTGTGRYVWNYVAHDHQCPLRAVRHIQAQTTFKDLATVVRAVDDSLVQFTRLEPVSMCDRIIHPTDHEDYFLLDPEEAAPVIEPLPDQEAKMANYVAARDEFVYTTISELIQQQVERILTRQCNQTYQHLRSENWLRHQLPGLTHWLRGSNTFGRQVGEVLYIFDCEPIRPLLRPVETCYEDLPVTWGSQEGYVEPLRRRFKKTSSPMPCSTDFPYVFEAAPNVWLEMTPQVRLRGPPDVRPQVNRTEAQVGRQYAWKTGGLYSSRVFDETAQDFDDARRSLAGRLTYQMGTTQDPQAPLSPMDLFPPDLWDFSRVFGRLHMALEFLGQITSILTGVYLVYRIVAAVLSCLYIGTVLRHLRERIGWVLCPLLFVFRKVHSEAPELPNVTGKAVQPTSKPVGTTGPTAPPNDVTPPSAPSLGKLPTAPSSVGRI